MAQEYRYLQNHEQGLSEVVGFVLILGVLVLVFSLYLTYGVPAQGRENEILHMNEVKDQFVTYKISLDSLFNNNKVGTAVSNSFTLGTAGGYTQGTISFIPIMSPVASSGTVSINQRTKNPETLTLSSDALILNSSNFYSVDLPAQVNYTPDHVYVNIYGIQSGDLAPAGVFGVNVSGKNWAAYINLTPRMTYYQAVTLTGSGGLDPYKLGYQDAYNYNRSDLAITVKKGGITTIQDFTVYRNVSSGTIYSMDLMDDAYGLKPLIIPPDRINLVVDKPLNTISATGNITYGFSEMNPYTVTPVPLGAINYIGQNNYWIPQQYYYQMGGVFLAQTDGNITYKLPPEITFSYDNQSDPAHKIVTVNINALTIDPGNFGIVGGNSPVQIKTTLSNITTQPFVKGPANARWIRIGINTTDNQARTMWGNYFNYSATVAGVPNYVIGQAGTESYIRIDGYDSSPTGNYVINVIASNASYATTIHGVGGIVQ
jgi:hypothetical protein